MRRMNSSDGSRSLEIDFDKEILKINGQEVKERIGMASIKASVRKRKANVRKAKRTLRKKL